MPSAPRLAAAILLAACPRPGDSPRASPNGDVGLGALRSGRDVRRHRNLTDARHAAPARTFDAPGDTAQSSRVLRVVADVPLPGPANRFDYQSVDSTRRPIYISQMNAGTLVVLDLERDSVVAEVSGLPRATSPGRSCIA